MAVGHPLTVLSEGGDAYGYMDGVIDILSCTIGSCFLVKKQVEDKDECRPDNRTAAKN